MLRQQDIPDFGPNPASALSVQALTPHTPLICIRNTSTESDLVDDQNICFLSLQGIYFGALELYSRKLGYDSKTNSLVY